MREVLVAVGLVLAVGCAPPPEVGSDPAEPGIRIVYPSETTDVHLDSDGVLRLFVAVSIDNFDFVAPVVGQVIDPVDGQGHYHLDVNNKPTPYAEELGAEIEVKDLTVDAPVVLKVSLVTNDHLPVLDASGAQVVDVLELVAGAPLTDPGTGDDTAADTGA